MLVQVLCNKKYACPTNKTGLSFDESDTKNSQTPPKRNKTKGQNQTNIELATNKQQKVSIEEQPFDSIIIGEPESNYPSILKKTCCNNETLNPSFNLKSNQKSTPVKHCHNCTNTVFQPNLSQSTLKNSLQHTPDTKIKVEVHTQANESDGSFESCINY